ncbi:MAG: hypothetical protein R3B45_15195 [Bdellovibrionota bacterium]
MFKAFLRTDGIVVVDGGDIAWKFQRKQFQRLITVKFAYIFLTSGKYQSISDLSSKERTVCIKASDFVGSESDIISNSEYLYCRGILKDIAAGKQQQVEVSSIAG